MAERIQLLKNFILREKVKAPKLHHYPVLADASFLPPGKPLIWLIGPAIHSL
jgi:hypothetical protein